jgi:hypothetical protein
MNRAGTPLFNKDAQQPRFDAETLSTFEIQTKLQSMHLYTT